MKLNFRYTHGKKVPDEQRSANEGGGLNLKAFGVLILILMLVMSDNNLLLRTRQN